MSKLYVSRGKETHGGKNSACWGRKENLGEKEKAILLAQDRKNTRGERRTDPRKKKGMPNEIVATAGGLGKRGRGSPEGKSPLGELKKKSTGETLWARGEAVVSVQRQRQEC